MPVEPFVDSPEPQDPQATIWRYVEFWKFEDLVKTGELYLRRADCLNDPREGLPEAEYEKILQYSRYDLRDILKRDTDIGSLAQFRQAFYVSCWHLQSAETAKMWGQYGLDGVAIVTRYDILKRVLDATPDRFLVGRMRYGLGEMTGWNVIRFVTTKNEKWAGEREVRAMLWLLDTGDGVNRHIDVDNRPHDRPLLSPPATMPQGPRRAIDVRSLILEVVVSPHAPARRVSEVKTVLDAAGLDVPVTQSPLTRYARFIPTHDELEKYL